MRFNITKAIVYGVAIWLVGFFWGSFVFMTPSLRNVKPIPYISANPAVSFPILLMWFPLAYVIARIFLKNSKAPESDGFRLGLAFSEVNFVLDVIIIVILFNAGVFYFTAASVWFAYAMLVLIPWLTGRSLAKALPD